MAKDRERHTGRDLTTRIHLRRVWCRPHASPVVRGASTVALIQSDNAIVVADPGMVTDRGLIIDPLNKAGVSPQDVTHIFISHHHPDHTVNIALFPNAEVVDFWGMYKGDMWRDHGDSHAIAPGITVLRTPGHTAEDASLVVETADGTY